MKRRHRHAPPRRRAAVRRSPSGPRRLAPEMLRRIDAYWRAANYLSVGQIYLIDNPLLRRTRDSANTSRCVDA